MERRRFAREFKLEAVKLIRNRGVAAIPGQGSSQLLGRVSFGQVALRRCPLSLALTRRLGVSLRNCRPNSR